MLGQPPGQAFAKQGGAGLVCLGLEAQVSVCGVQRSGRGTRGVLRDGEKGHWREAFGKSEQNALSS